MATPGPGYAVPETAAAAPAPVQRVRRSRRSSICGLVDFHGAVSGKPCDEDGTGDPTALLDAIVRLARDVEPLQAPRSPLAPREPRAHTVRLGRTRSKTLSHPPTRPPCDVPRPPLEPARARTRPRRRLSLSGSAPQLTPYESAEWTDRHHAVFSRAMRERRLSHSDGSLLDERYAPLPAISSEAPAAAAAARYGM